MSNSHRTSLVRTALFALVATSGLAVSSALAGDPYADLKNTITLDAVIRDFKPTEGGKAGHPDFETFSNSCITIDLVKPELDADGKPVFAGKSGLVITKEFKNEAGQCIYPYHADKKLRKLPVKGEVQADNSVKGGPWTDGSDKDKGGGNDKTEAASIELDDVKDVKGELKANDKSGTGSATQLTSMERFNEWYRDVPGVNSTKVVPLTLNRVPNTNRYVFDSDKDQPYKDRGGFFPIDGELFGNYGSYKHNFSFTTEITTHFVYEQGKRQVFTFTGDDDVWVFIGGKLVLDLGGLHPKRTQTLELDRLDLINGKDYEFKIFHAERHTTASNFRIETTITLQPAETPAMTNLFD